MKLIAVIKKMNIRIKGKNWCYIAFVLALLAFILFEMRFVNRPYYWDEAWSYAQAVSQMTEQGPSLLPGAIHEYLYRGHPTFFYFITSVWLKIFGTSLISAHSFFLIISVCLILSVFFIGKDLANELAGLIASICLMVTPLFIAQATFMLPEVMLALFSLLTLYFYVKNKPGLEILFAALLVYTKETGIVLVGTIILFDFIRRIISADNFKTFIAGLPKFLLHFIPLVLVSLFFILQKIKLGWFFYPEHVGMMEFEKSVIKYKLNTILNYTLNWDGRFIMSFGIFILLFVYLHLAGLKEKIQQFIFLSFLFICFYILFSALNFFTIRYLTSVLPILYLVFSVLFIKVFRKKAHFSIAIVLLFGLFSMKEIIYPSGVGDSKPGFIQMIEIHKQTVNYLEEENFFDNEIGTHFLMLYNLKDPFLGYLKSDKIFKKAQVYNGEPKDIVIVSSVELNDQLKQVQSDTANYKLIRQFKNDLAWCEIYKKK